MKIYPLDELPEIIPAGRRLVLCHGVFDLLHIGHIRYFEQARTFGDILIVTVTADEFVNKGPDRPAFSEDLRAEAVASLSCVDYVAINHGSSAERPIRVLEPNVYVKGAEYRDAANDVTGKIQEERALVESFGGKMRFTEDVVFSSSTLINRHLSNFPKELQEYLEIFRRCCPLDDVLEVIEGFSKLNVLVVGDTIMDEYVTCEAIGKSSKDPVLVVQETDRECFKGGTWAIADHLESFVDSVYQPTPFTTTTTKTRFVDGYSLQKLFEVYSSADEEILRGEMEDSYEEVTDLMRYADIVIVADYGHGAINSALVEILSQPGHRLALNVQANAGNRGLHTVSRYPRADVVCLAEHEIRLEARDLDSPLRVLMDQVAKKLRVETLAVTTGRQGCLIRSRDGGFVAVPAFAANVVDRVGAGDAFFALMSLGKWVAPEIMGFLGNVAGAMHVGTMGNRTPIDKVSFVKYVTAILK